MSKRKQPRTAKSTARAANTKLPGKTDSGAIWLYGHHAVDSALRNPARTCHRLLVSGNAAGAVAKTLAGISHPRPAPEQVAREKIDHVVPEGAVHQGVALQVAPLQPLRLEDLIRQSEDGTPCSLAVVDQGSDPRNVGAVLRSAAAFGIDALIVQDRHAPEATGALAKAASGALEIVPMVRVTNLARALEQLKEAGFWTVGLAGDTELTIGELQWPERSVIVLGAEDTGLRRLTRENCDFIVRIPMRPETESLNLSNAAAIAFYAAFSARTAAS